MAIFVLRNGYVKLGTTDVSDHIREVSVNLSADDVDVTAMGAGGHQHLAGIRDDRFTLTAYSDFSSSIDSIIWPIFSAAGTILVEVAANSSTAAVTNPVYYHNSCSLLTYTPISGAVGDAATTPLEFVCSGTISVRTA